MKALARGIAVLFVSLAVAQAASGDWQVWTTSETRHVLRQDPPANGLAVKWAAARNECRGFQVLLRSDSAVSGIRVQAGDLTGPGGAVLAPKDARLYRQHQLELTVGTYRHDGLGR